MGDNADMADQNDAPIRLTTAEALGNYYRELIGQELPTDLAADLLRNAGEHMHRDGITIGRVAR